MPMTARPVASTTEHRGTPAIQKMVEFAPATGGLALWIQHQNVDAANKPLLVANDGRTIYYGPQFDNLPLARQIGLVAHQVLHVALRHPQRSAALQRLLGDVDTQLFTVCADAIVNSTLEHLPWLQLPPNAVTLDKLLHRVLWIDQAVETALLEWDVERLYRAIDDRDSLLPRKAHDQGRSGQGGTPQPRYDQAHNACQDGPRSAAARQMGHDMIDDLLTADSEEHPEDQAEQSREWAERIVRAHASDGEHSMLRTLLADLPKIRTPWAQLLRTQLTRGLRQQPDVSWSRPARSWLARRGRSATGRRLPWEPGIVAAKRVPRLAVMVDVSGSIDAPLLERFAREIEAITRRTEATLTLVIGDDTVQRVEHFQPGRSALRDIVFQGGGGTDFSPLLAEANRHRPDLGVVLTDLEGPAEFRPRWPVLWAVPAACEAVAAPFGRKLVLAD
jgi:predicted metal-dependent peptidase